MTATSIAAPAGYAPTYATGFADAGGQFTLVSHASPLPVATAAPAPEPLAGQTSAAMLAGPFAATVGRAIVVTLAGEWSGTVRLLRSTDGGVTLVPLRAAGSAWGQYSEPGCEQAWSETEQGVSFYLDIALVSGTLDYRVSQ
jgi:hypothetical protein